MMNNNIHVAQVFSTPWERKLANDLVAELERYSGERGSSIEEMRRLLAVKGYRDLLSRLQAACEKKRSFEALRVAAHTMRLYALERPAMSAATFRTPTTDTSEWRAAVDDLRVFMMGIMSECGLRGEAADQALRILRSLVRGFVVHEVMDSFFDPVSYEECYGHAIEMFMAGLPMLAGMHLKIVRSERDRPVRSRADEIMPIIPTTPGGLTGRTPDGLPSSTYAARAG